MQPSPPDPAPEKLRLVQAGVDRIGRALRQSTRPGWIRLDLLARVTVDLAEMTVFAVRPDGAISSADAVPDVRAAVLDLRRMMYEPGSGAWLSLRATVDPPAAMQLNLNYNDDPLWSRPVPGSSYRRDLQAFPRPPELLSPWLQSRLDDPV